MQRITISIDDQLGQSLDRQVSARSYASRSEAVRDLVREGLEHWRAEDNPGDLCVANLSYIVDHRVRALPQRLAELQHAHHDLVAASTVVRLDHFHSMESVILKGATAAVHSFANQVRGERGVKFGALNLLAASTDHQHGIADHHHDEATHLRPAV
ncbi:nickel-responsive transcriptional regulator NikR [Novosphingobium album (ex Liu et al. 2023)]|uniref:Putative nickel-responsive regulator n=1 Tax=Novosphingobium album (ex Liu et al. 2023) TaxID=3031130 RepID=A0ABT5WUQ4_9SPHN|nr:nickel-responsive transcriptional regulator NikR [Novosphingobium album (ex Liu et al. 2023)]MDE8653606.1 nickel-responsive transcriptional regulator NikR [Novosphingobium album (ex Liu et al. 2023)]